MPLPGDAFGGERDPVQAVMTRAITIRTPPTVASPWIAQLGRGAGWYSYDLIDNGGRMSARHLVSWIPPPRIGDASAIGYLREIDDGTSLTWWVPGERAAGAVTRMAFHFHLTPIDAGTRLVVRVSAGATGTTARPLVWAFTVVDSIMAIRQLAGIKERAESYGTRRVDPGRAETGDRSQYQVYEVVYADGDRAGVPGREGTAMWRRAWLAADGETAGAHPASSHVYG